MSCEVLLKSVVCCYVVAYANSPQAYPFHHLLKIDSLFQHDNCIAKIEEHICPCIYTRLSCLPSGGCFGGPRDVALCALRTH